MPPFLYLITTGFLVLSFSSAVLGAASPGKKEVLAVMETATDFMMNRVSNRGGFLYHYTEDLSKQWGEIPARSSQIWVQPPGTPTVGEMLLAAYQATGDVQYLKYAGRVAEALIWGQHPSGGWHYFIDFDPAGIAKFYEEVASQCRGWEEFYYYYDNATFDDDVTASATRFLLHLYTTSMDPRYKPALIKALDFVLLSQYPNGGWPQRYPLRHDFSHDDHPDYTSFYTYNDGVMSNNIYLLLEAYEKLGNEEYRKAANRGMDFYIVSQLPSPQAGWAQQYDMDLKPAWARSYEPAALCSSQTIDNIKDLQTFYLMTGDCRYLRPIPEAIQWLERSTVNTDPSKKGTHATFYEVGSNRPLYVHHESRDGKLARYWVDYEPVELPDYGMWLKVDIAAIKKGYEQLKGLTPEKATAEYQAKRRGGQSAPQATAEEVSRLISSLDKRGAWITEIKFLDTNNYADNPPLRFRGIDTATYISNMHKLMGYLKSLK
jgi:PelA/Pel-15E family pectate lyase